MTSRPDKRNSDAGEHWLRHERFCFALRKPYCSTVDTVDECFGRSYISSTPSVVQAVLH